MAKYKVTITFRKEFGESNNPITLESDHGIRWESDATLVWIRLGGTSYVYPISTILNIVEEDTEYQRNG